MAIIETGSGSVSISYQSILYYLDDSFRNVESDNLAFLYALRDLDITRVTNRFLPLRKCMTEYFSDSAFVGRTFMDICRDIAEKMRLPFSEVRSDLEYTLDMVWNGYDYHRLKSRYDLSPEDDLADAPNKSRLLSLFCLLAYVNYKELIFGR